MGKHHSDIDSWKALRPALNNSYDFNQNWSNAVAIFNNRIRSRYLNAIDDLILINKNEGEGFTIVTIQCALIETFSAFRQGKVYNHDKVGELPRYEYKKSETIFTGFLRSESIFKDIFWVLNKKGKVSIDQPYNAKDFYTEVRCALMHEARTKGNWLINALVKDKPGDKVFIKQRAKGISIYRTIFQKVLIDYFNQYKIELQTDDNVFNDLRRCFARKLDNLYDIKDNFEWWTDT